MAAKLILSAVVCAVLPGGAHAAGSEGGAALYAAHCAMCHLDPHAPNGDARIGPPLAGVVGGKAAAAPGYTRYSSALRKSGTIWTDAALNAYFEAPMRFMPGTTMALVGVTNAAERAT
ncbi:MAG: c-type cytochrome, partial [Polymorphobacter sp.]